MVVDYARSAVVYRELRAAFGPWCKENGYKRQRGTDAGWKRELGNGEDLIFSLRCDLWGSGATGGSDFYCLIQTEPSGAAGLTINRQVDVSFCMTEAQLDELRQLQNEINRRRPSFPQRDDWMREASPVGEHTRDMYRQYDRGEKPYRVGEFVRFGYYGVGDVRIHADFLVRHLPEAIVRFVEGRCAQPSPRPPSAFIARVGRALLAKKPNT
jgi:hypothetical protein